MLSPDGSINENGAPFTGMMRYDARMAVEEALKEKVWFRILRRGADFVYLSVTISSTLLLLNCRAFIKERNRTR